jgi:four helix bundle protein
MVFKELLVWQKAMDLVEEVYKISAFLPKEETFSLAAQIKRAAVSVPSNIAEGNSRNSIKEYINFLGIARGSNSEVYTQLLICVRLGYVKEEHIYKASLLSEEIAKMINAMIIKLSNKSGGKKE